MAYVVGIDLGTTNSCAAVVEGDKVVGRQVAGQVAQQVAEEIDLRLGGEVAPED